MNRYEKMFKRLSGRAGAFVPFTVLGDPSFAMSGEIISTLLRSGADALELGIPFSDPIADGPTIQSATRRALEAGITPDACFELIAQLRGREPDLPIGLLVYANLVTARGEQRFYQQARTAGVDSVLVADLPIFEAAPFIENARSAGIAPVFIATPNAKEKELRTIAQSTKGYTYVVTRFGVTGARDNLALDCAELLTQLKSWGAPPALLGFGISKPEQVHQAMRIGANGAISGSAIARIIEEHAFDSPSLLSSLFNFVSSMKEATYLGQP